MGIRTHGRMAVQLVLSLNSHLHASPAKQYLILGHCSTFGLDTRLAPGGVVKQLVQSLTSNKGFEC